MRCCPRPVDFCTCKHFGRLLTFHWGHMFLLLPTLSGKHSFENRRNNTFSLGRPKLQKRTNNLEIIRTYMLWFSRRRGVEHHCFTTPTEHGDQTKKRSARSMGITVRVFFNTSSARASVLQFVFDTHKNKKSGSEKARMAI